MRPEWQVHTTLCREGEIKLSGANRTNTTSDEIVGFGGDVGAVENETEHSGAIPNLVDLEGDNVVDSGADSSNSGLHVVLGDLHAVALGG